MGELGLRERKKLRTREPIATVALDLFAERGYQQTAVAEIAEAAEVSKGTLLAYFPSKEEIVFADTSPLRDQLCHELRHQQRPVGGGHAARLRGRPHDHTRPTRGARERLIAENEQLRVHYRARLAEVEDALAEAIAARSGRAGRRAARRGSPPLQPCRRLRSQRLRPAACMGPQPRAPRRWRCSTRQRRSSRVAWPRSAPPRPGGGRPDGGRARASAALRHHVRHPGRGGDRLRAAAVACRARAAGHPGRPERLRPPAPPGSSPPTC